MSKPFLFRPQGTAGGCTVNAVVTSPIGVVKATIAPAFESAEADETAKLFAFAPRLLAEVKRIAADYQSRRAPVSRMPTCQCPGCSMIRLAAEYEAFDGKAVPG